MKVCSLCVGQDLTIPKDWRYRSYESKKKHCMLHITWSHPKITEVEKYTNDIYENIENIEGDNAPYKEHKEDDESINTFIVRDITFASVTMLNACREVREKLYKEYSADDVDYIIDEAIKIVKSLIKEY